MGKLNPEDQRNMVLWGPFWQRVARGEVDLSVYSDEEILDARIKTPDNRLLPPPKALPTEWVKEQHRRGLRVAESKIRDGAQRALEVMYEIMDDDRAPRQDRLRAANFFTDRFLGKAPEQIKVAKADTLEELYKRFLSDDEDDEGAGDGDEG